MPVPSSVQHTLYEVKIPITPGNMYSYASVNIKVFLKEYYVANLAMGDWQTLPLAARGYP